MLEVVKLNRTTDSLTNYGTSTASTQIQDHQKYQEWESTVTGQGRNAQYFINKLSDKSDKELDLNYPEITEYPDLSEFNHIETIYFDHSIALTKLPQLPDNTNLTIYLSKSQENLAPTNRNYQVRILDEMVHVTSPLTIDEEVSLGSGAVTPDVKPPTGRSLCQFVGAAYSYVTQIEWKKEITEAVRDNPIMPWNSPIQFFIWGGVRPLLYTFFWSSGDFLGKLLQGANPTDTNSILGKLTSGGLGATAEAICCLLSDLAAGKTWEESRANIATWAIAAGVGGALWTDLANIFLDGKTDLTLDDFTKIAPAMSKVGASAAAIFSVTLFAAKLALRIYDPDHHGALTIKTFIRDCVIFSMLFVAATDAAFCLSSFAGWFNDSAELKDGFAGAGVAVLKQILLSMTGAFTGGIAAASMGVISCALVCLALPIGVQLVKQYCCGGEQPTDMEDGEYVAIDNNPSDIFIPMGDTKKEGQVLEYPNDPSMLLAHLPI
jgi:hypothetical protein